MKKEFKINTEIYPTEAVEQTISDFAEVWQPHPSPLLKGEGIVKTIEINGNNIEEIDEIFNEFMNYIIGLINE